MLGTDWFDKSRARLDFDKNTLNVKYLGKQVTVNATHVSKRDLPQELEEFTDEEDWIDELENAEEFQEVFLSDTLPSEDEDLFYNPWSDENLTAYLVESCKENKILFNINKELEREQLEQAESLLNKSVHIFAQKISKEGQTVGLGQTNLVYHEIDTGNAKPISQRPYTLARDEQEFLQKEILAMKEQGIIFELKSP